MGEINANTAISKVENNARALEIAVARLGGDEFGNFLDDIKYISWPQHKCLESESKNELILI